MRLGNVSDVEFYGIAAQVIPVFFLAMTFESRSLMRLPNSYDPDADPKDPARWNATQIVGTLFLTVLMFGGESAALVGVYLDRVNDLANGLTWIGLASGLLGVALPVLGYQWGLLRRHRRAGGEAWILLLVAALLIVLLRTVVGWFLH